MSATPLGRNVAHVTSRRQQNSAETPEKDVVAPTVAARHETWGMRRWRILGLLAVLGCTRPSARAPGVMIGALRHGLQPYLAEHPLGPGAEIRADMIERTDGTSVHIVQVRGRERPHRHLEHDLVVHVLLGEGIFTLEGEKLPLAAGDVVVVKRGATHGFAPAPGTTVVTLVTFAPPLDAPDSVPVGDVDSGDARR